MKSQIHLNDILEMPYDSISFLIKQTFCENKKHKIYVSLSLKFISFLRATILWKRAVFIRYCVPDGFCVVIVYCFLLLEGVGRIRSGSTPLANKLQNILALSTVRYLENKCKDRYDFLTWTLCESSPKMQAWSPWGCTHYVTSYSHLVKVTNNI